MKLSLLRNFFPIFLCPFIANVVTAQTSTSDGYTGYSLTLEGDPDSTVYDTASTAANVSTTVPEPDVFLNASVSVGEIDITVSNLTAKINLDVQVLQLLTVCIIAFGRCCPTPLSNLLSQIVPASHEPRLRLLTFF